MAYMQNLYKEGGSGPSAFDSLFTGPAQLAQYVSANQPAPTTGLGGGGVGFGFGGTPADPSLGTGVGPGLASTTAAAGGHAMDPITMAALASVIGSALSSAFAPSPYQQRTGFTGEADPQSWLSQFRGTTSATLENALSRLTDPTNVENLRVPNLGTFASDPGLYGDFGQHATSKPRVTSGPVERQPYVPLGAAPAPSGGGTGGGPTRIRPNVLGNTGLAPSSPFGAPSAVPTSQAHGAAQLLLHALTMPTESEGQGRRGARAA